MKTNQISPSAVDGAFALAAKLDQKAAAACRALACLERLDASRIAEGKEDCAKVRNARAVYAEASAASKIALELARTLDEALAAMSEAATAMHEVGAKYPELHGTNTGPSTFGAAFLRLKRAAGIR
jgi:crotonobetainyl-CoA:carnitine CoA-transferase CaiB-like acyl-CoA transferase